MLFIYNVPPDYDPRLDHLSKDCINNFPVYDQGSCGCCYGTAMAQMFGMRRCILDQRAKYAAKLSGRRLETTPVPTAPVTFDPPFGYVTGYGALASTR